MPRSPDFPRLADVNEQVLGKSRLKLTNERVIKSRPYVVDLGGEIVISPERGVPHSVVQAASA